ncbi:MAG: hydroxypyruvate isomerase [Rhodobacteraceae bacterium]|nr:hydroxypyruvate isomerase [Paracoccaceae bacterium]
MPRFAANLTLLWTELPYLDRFAAAAEAGFTGAEVLFPYDIAAQDTRRALIASGLDFVLMNAPPPNYTGGVPGYAALPGGEDRFSRDIRRVMRYAELLRPAFIHVMAGEAEGPEARAAFVANLKAATAASPDQVFTIEPLNRGSFPGYFLADYDLAIDILDAVGAPNLGLQYDSFHAQEIHGDALAVWERVKTRVAHVQIGDVPGRGAPGSGGIDFPALFGAIGDSGYDGWISAEYQPGMKTEKTLDWMKG